VQHWRCSPETPVRRPKGRRWRNSRTCIRMRRRWTSLMHIGPSLTPERPWRCTGSLLKDGQPTLMIVIPIFTHSVRIEKQRKDKAGLARLSFFAPHREGRLSLVSLRLRAERRVQNASLSVEQLANLAGLITVRKCAAQAGQNLRLHEREECYPMSPTIRDFCGW
jgi:hypothetical protein